MALDFFSDDLAEPRMASVKERLADSGEPGPTHSICPERCFSQYVRFDFATAE
jgi:hypothetical protein